MTTITLPRATVEQALEALYEADTFHRNLPDQRARRLAAMAALRAALKQEEEASAWLAERKEYWRKEKEKMQATNALRAALAQQAEPVEEPITRLFGTLPVHDTQQDEPVAVAERERIAAQWDGCVTHQLDTFGPVDIGASIRAGELVGPAQQAEPVEPVAALTAQRDALLEALKSTGLFLHHCWCDVQMNDYSFKKLNQQMQIVDAAIKAVEEGK